MSIVAKMVTRTVTDETSVAVCDGCGAEAAVSAQDDGRLPYPWLIVHLASEYRLTTPLLHFCSAPCLAARTDAVIKLGAPR